MSDETPNESTSLLPKGNDSDEASEEIDANEKDDLQTRTHRIVNEFWILFKGSVPVILAYALQNSLRTFSVLIVGRLSPEALSVAAFCYMWAMATAWLIGMGGTTAIDTLASASFTGSKNKHDLGIILQRAFVVLTIFYIPIIVLWTCTEPVFRALGQEEYIAQDGSKFLIAFDSWWPGIHILRVHEEVPSSARNHEARKLRSFDHVTDQCRLELPTSLHLRLWSTWCSNCNKYLLLA